MLVPSIMTKCQSVYCCVKQRPCYGPGGSNGAIALLTEAAVKAKDKLPTATWVGLIFLKNQIAGRGS
ncbi:hypothetical protein AAFF_G00110650 [Aldrovandia affinis]|uniref:Uncharacterized protein n=1 Tax=Aldrovandia affinis TaxID=143900 RepID=A0AAD7RW10_9TELE|nr:hypothetical protein AAFF_G00110650 [Aldrovandia affinis]